MRRVQGLENADLRTAPATALLNSTNGVQTSDVVVHGHS